MRARRVAVVVLAILYSVITWPIWAARDLVAGFLEGWRRGRRRAITGKPGTVYECPDHGCFVPRELPRHYPDQPEAKCMAWLPGGTMYCGKYCPPWVPK